MLNEHNEKLKGHSSNTEHDLQKHVQRVAELESHKCESDNQLVADLRTEILLLHESNEKLKGHCSKAERELQRHVQRIAELELEVTSYDQIRQNEQTLRNILEERVTRLPRA